MRTKSEIVRQAASNIEKGRTYCWFDPACCQVGHIVQVIQDIPRFKISTPCGEWKFFYLRHSDNPHVIALKEAGFNYLDIESIEKLLEYERFGIKSGPPFLDKARVVAYMYAIANEWEEVARLSEVDKQRELLNRCLGGTVPTES